MRDTVGSPVNKKSISVRDVSGSCARRLLYEYSMLCLGLCSTGLLGAGYSAANSLRSSVPHLLLSDVSEDAINAALTPGERQVAAALKDHLALSDAQTVKLLVKHPEVLGYGWQSNIAPTLDGIQAALTLSDEDLKKVIQEAPPALGLSLQGTLLPRISALRALFGLSADQTRELVLRFPRLLLLSMGENVAPSAAALQSLLELSVTELRALVLKYPQVLSLSPTKNLAPTLQALRSSLGVDDADGHAPAAAEMRAIVLSMPSILGLNFETNLRPKLTFLAEAMQCTPSELRSALHRYPLVLGSSLEKSLRPNVNLWCRVLPAGEEAPLRTLVNKGGLRVLTASYEKRTKPRLESAQLAGIPASRLLTKMRLTDAAFDTWLLKESQRAGASDQEGPAPS